MQAQSEQADAEEEEDGEDDKRWMLRISLCFMTLEAFAYFTLNNVLTQHLSELLLVSDTDAGAYFGLRGALSLLYGTLLGPAIDWFGPRRVLPAAFILAAIGRAQFAVSTSLPMALFAMYGPMAAGHGLSFAALSICIKNATLQSTHASSWGFGLGYVALVLGIFLCGPVIDLSTYLAAPNTPYRFLAGMAAACSSLNAALSTIALHIWPDHHTAHSTHKPGLKEIWNTVRTARFARFTAFSIVILPACSVIRNLDGGILPKFLVRTFGSTVPKGSIYAINPLIDLIGVPLVTAKLSTTSHFSVLRVGLTIAALSPLVVFGLGSSMAAVILFVITLTAGDLLYNPRVNAYAMAVAPAGREGSFAGLASAATFLAEVPAGLLGGWLIEEHCPAPEDCDGSTMFGKLAGFAVLTPLCLWACPWVFYEPDMTCLLYTSDAADEEDSVDLGGRRIINKKKN
eukprot:TRINITY_DN6389_c0_g1_i2.p1 TRINITY_DN6389_c0_g1~~TRINITY_DN6389_c0_g1_i2.p1  ORF type:complete len:457 (+),score=81.93 TRINITY_DN6389_c0_g1_i2:55-1425(+)